MTLHTCAHVDVGPSGGSSVYKPGSEEPHRREKTFNKFSRVTQTENGTCYTDKYNIDTSIGCLISVYEWDKLREV